MIQLSALLAKLTEKNHLRFPSVPDGGRMVSRVDLLHPDILPDTDTLYLCADESLLLDETLTRRLLSLPLPPMILSGCQAEPPLPLICAEPIPDIRELFHYTYIYSS